MYIDKLSEALRVSSIFLSRGVRYASSRILKKKKACYICSKTLLTLSGWTIHMCFCSSFLSGQTDASLQYGISPPIGGLMYICIGHLEWDIVTNSCFIPNVNKPSWILLGSVLNFLTKFSVWSSYKRIVLNLEMEIPNLSLILLYFHKKREWSCDLTKVNIDDLTVIGLARENALACRIIYWLPDPVLWKHFLGGGYMFRKN